MSGLDFTRNQKLALCAIAGLMVIGLSVSHIKNGLTRNGQVIFREPNQGGASVVTSGSDTMPVTDQNSGSVVVHVTGRVKSPGVYSLPSGKRVIDAINEAGGSLGGADLQSMNLAARLEDGSRIYVPAVGEAPAGTTQPVAAAGAPMVTVNTAAGVGAGASTASSKPNGDKFTTPGEGVVHINSASVEELQRLPGVGPSTAQKIVDYRSQVGKFSSPEGIMDVKGIGPKKYEKMRPFVAL
ncbi:MAG: helix-hairpin-helix domain-containing protein [Armatimonadota bacterium]|nr:helix-hairpin-helix domain-containing protein [bacterium]